MACKSARGAKLHVLTNSALRGDKRFDGLLPGSCSLDHTCRLRSATLLLIQSVSLLPCPGLSQGLANFVRISRGWPRLPDPL